MSQAILAPIVARDPEHLQKLVKTHIAEHGRYVDLNHIDVSGVHSFDGLFFSTGFRGNVSKWDVSNARSMVRMFASCHFNGDISRWDVSNVMSMESLFMGGAFNGDLSSWHVVNVRNMMYMFACNLRFDQDLSGWFVHPGTSARGMFDQTRPHKKQYQSGLRLPIFSSTLPDMFNSDTCRMHEYLARTPICRYHWDVLLEDLGAPWATSDMRLFVTAVAPMLSQTNGEGYYPHLSAELNRLWHAPGRVPGAAPEVFHLEFETAS